MKKMNDFGSWLDNELKRLHVSKSSIRLEGTHRATLNDLVLGKKCRHFSHPRHLPCRVQPMAGGRLREVCHPSGLPAHRRDTAQAIKTTLPPPLTSRWWE